MKVKRRDFFKTAGILGAGAFAFNPALELFSQATSARSGLQAGSWFPSTCQGCTTWCPVEIFVQNGRAVKVRGNQNSAINNGYCCPRGHMIPKLMYDPDRVKVPLTFTALPF